MQRVIQSSLPNPEPASRLIQRTSSSLLSALKKEDDPDAFTRFLEAYTLFVQRIAQRENLTAEESKDLVQDVALGVFRRIERFKHNGRVGAFRKWLKKLATWRAKDIRRRGRMPLAEPLYDENGEMLDPLAGVPDPVEAMGSVYEDDLLEMLVRRLESQVAVRDLQLFVAVVRDGAHGGDLAVQFGMTRGSVDTAVSRVRSRAREALEALEVRLSGSGAHA